MNNININSNDSFFKLIKAKEDLIKDLNEKLNRFPFILEKNERLMSVIFSSVNQKVNYSIVCKNTDTIHNLEVKLYQEFPSLYESENYFLCKGQIINKFKTFEENNFIGIESDFKDLSSVENKQDLLYGTSCYQIDIKGFYERNGSYVLSGLNVRPYKIEKHD